MKDYIAIDTETGGLEADRCALLSVAMVPSWGAEPFAVRILPAYGLRVDEAAARVNGYDPAVWEADPGVMTEKMAAVAMLSWLNRVAGPEVRRRFVMVAHNAGFDSLFLFNWMMRTGYGPILCQGWVCTQLRMVGLREKGVLPRQGKNRLDDLGLMCGFWRKNPRGDHHDALVDAKACAAGYEWLVEQEAAFDAKKEGGAAA